jgi:hypothetical protein
MVVEFTNCDGGSAWNSLNTEWLAYDRNSRVLAASDGLSAVILEHEGEHQQSFAALHVRSSAYPEPLLRGAG